MQATTSPDLTAGKQAFIHLEFVIRHAQQPDHPELLQDYLQLAKQLANHARDAEASRQTYLHVAHILLEVICDSYLPQHWRMLCLNNIYQPIFALQALAKTEQHKQHVRRFSLQLHTLGNYFL